MEELENIKWLGHASFYFIDKTTGNTIYYIDPFNLQGPLQKADLVFITHAHSDHFSPPDLAKILKTQTAIIATPDILSKITRSQQKIEVLPNNSYQVRGFSFKTIPAYNTHPQKLAFHPKENNWVGYIFTLNGKKVYHAGDTDFIEEMKKLKDENLDIAMLPIGGMYTMDAREAASAANAIAAKITVPMHYKRLLGNSYKEAEDTFKKEVTNSKVLILQNLF